MATPTPGANCVINNKKKLTSSLSNPLDHSISSEYDYYAAIGGHTKAYGLDSAGSVYGPIERSNEPSGSVNDTAFLQVEGGVGIRQVRAPLCGVHQPEFIGDLISLDTHC